MGGHPSTDGAALLPGQQGFPSVLLWVDLAGHLFGVWKSTARSAERLLDSPIPKEWGLPNIPSVVDRWERKDGLTGVVRALHQMKRDNPDTFAFDRPSPT
jgi:hypothetical protein